MNIFFLVDEAIVLLIRERADQIDDLCTTTASQNNSFSKYSSEILEALRDFKDDSLMAHDEDGESNGKRSRSVTPSRVSLSKMMSRLAWRLNKNLEIKEEDENGEEREIKEVYKRSEDEGKGRGGEGSEEGGVGRREVREEKRGKKRGKRGKRGRRGKRGKREKSGGGGGGEEMREISDNFMM